MVWHWDTATKRERERLYEPSYVYLGPANTGGARHQVWRPLPSTCNVGHLRKNQTKQQQLSPVTKIHIFGWWQNRKEWRKVFICEYICLCVCDRDRENEREVFRLWKLKECYIIMIEMFGLDFLRNLRKLHKCLALKHGHPFLSICTTLLPLLWPFSICLFLFHISLFLLAELVAHCVSSNRFQQPNPPIQCMS